MIQMYVCVCVCIDYSSRALLEDDQTPPLDHVEAATAHGSPAECVHLIEEFAELCHELQSIADVLVVAENVLLVSIDE